MIFFSGSLIQLKTTKSAIALQFFNPWGAEAKDSTNNKICSQKNVFSQINVSIDELIDIQISELRKLQKIKNDGTRVHYQTILISICGTKSKIVQSKTQILLNY